MFTWERHDLWRGIGTKNSQKMICKKLGSVNPNLFVTENVRNSWWSTFIIRREYFVKKWRNNNLGSFLPLHSSLNENKYFFHDTVILNDILSLDNRLPYPGEIQKGCRSVFVLQLFITRTLILLENANS